MALSENLRTRVGKYELGRVLHDGAFAKVKYGRDIETGRSVAIKILSKDIIFKHKLVDQIKRDISTMKLLKHPNVVQMYEVIASKSKIYVVLEYVAGGELFKEIAHEGRLKEDMARKFFQQLINAVDYCHSRSIYHRDLKPDNLLLDGHGNLKISDFGFSALPQHLRGDGLLHTACGTPNYVAPEVFLCKGYDGAKADTWSCGVILFVLMAGYLPFEDSNLVNLYKKINKAEFKCPPWFSPNACKLLSKILNPKPALRATITQILRDPWFKKDYSPPSFEEDSDIMFDGVDTVLNESMDDTRQPRQPVHLNAFELIALSNELDLSSLFGKKQDLKHELHFTSRHPASEIILRMEETAKPLGFNVLKHDYKMKLQGSEMGRTGHLSVAAEVFEVAPSLFMVEVRKAYGDSADYHKFYQNLSKGLSDIVWKNEDLLG